MQRVFIDDPAWLATFPNRVAPLPDEWLPGLLLRCDEVNDWGSGTTRTHLFRSIMGKTYLYKYTWIVMDSLTIDYLSQVLAIPVSAILATTFRTELSRLNGTSNPYSRQLNTSLTLHICPECLAQAQGLRRMLALPLIEFCPSHHVALQKACPCGAQLRFFSPLSPPFTCYRCGLEWAKFPQVRAQPERIMLEKKLLSYYEFFFSNGTPTLQARALRLIRERIKEKAERRIPLLRGITSPATIYFQHMLSLGYLVDLLVSLDLSLNDLMTYETQFLDRIT